jgi:iron complex outermembrane receptor protein
LEFSTRAGILFHPAEETPPPPQRQDTRYEIGSKHEFLDRKMTFELGLFDVTRNNVAIPNSANPSSFCLLVTERQHCHGVAVNVGGEIQPNLRVAGAATLFHALVAIDSNTPLQKGSHLLGAPRRVHSVNANYICNCPGSFDKLTPGAGISPGFRDRRSGLR